MLDLFREVCAIDLNDGVAFDVDRLAITANREDLSYGGLRLETYATISGARLRIVVDIGFGNAIEPGLEDLHLPVLLDQPAPKLRAYARETVIAEKFPAMVMLGQITTRIKDYYDIWLLAKFHEFDTPRLADAIGATFRRPDTAIPTDRPVGLTAAFAENVSKKRQWTAFVDDVAGNPGSLAVVIEDLAAFLMPAALRAVDEAHNKSKEGRGGVSDDCFWVDSGQSAYGSFRPIADIAAHTGVRGGIGPERNSPWIVTIRFLEQHVSSVASSTDWPDAKTVALLRPFTLRIATLTN